MAHGDDIVRIKAEQLREVADASRFGTVRVWTGADAKGPWVKFDYGWGWTPPLRELP